MKTLQMMNDDRLQAERDLRQGAVERARAALRDLHGATETEKDATIRVWAAAEMLLLEVLAEQERRGD